MTSTNAAAASSTPVASQADAAHLSHPDEASGPTVALVGNPNVGKSTIFNGATGARQRTVNAPGTTVEVKAGNWKAVGARILDLPGTYSLIPNSPDEKVVADTLAGIPGSLTDPATGRHVDLVLAVLDGGSLTRSLYLLGQIGQTGHAVAAVITMADVAQDNGQEIDFTGLSRKLGIPVLVMDGRKSADHKVLNDFVSDALATRPHISGIDVDPSAPGYFALAAARAALQTCSDQVTIGDGRDLLAQTTCGCGEPQSRGNCCSKGLAPERIPEPKSRKSLLAKDCCEPGGPTDTASSTTSTDSCCGAPVASLGIPATREELRAQIRKDAESIPAVPSGPNSDAELKRASRLFTWVEGVEKSLAAQPSSGRVSRSDKVDRVLLNPFVGPLFFFGVMWLLFQLAGVWVSPIQDKFDYWLASTDDGAISLANGLLWVLGQVGLEGTWVESLLVNGLATGLGVVGSFVPLMFAIFAAISILEDSGYMARAAFLGDRVMRKIGLDGRVILPLIMGFGCNLPALAAARTLPSAAQRLVTVLITPYTSCAARLTIYLMIAKIFFPENTGTVVWSMYVLSVLMVVLAAWALKQVYTKNEAQAPLMLILPAYQLPRILVLLRNAWLRSWAFVKGAGKIIVVMTMFVWLLGAIPTSSNHSFADPEMPMQESAYGRVAQVIAPVFAPAGFDDWHLSGALMTGFVAKETVVSSIVASYNMDASAAGDAESNGDNLGELPDLITATFERTAGAEHAGLAAIAFLVFVLTYTPCLATVAEQVRQIGGKRTTIAVGVQLVIAWLLAVGVFQIGRLIV